MKFTLLLAPGAVEDFQALPSTRRARVWKAIAGRLGNEPEVVRRGRTVRLTGERRPQLRVRVDEDVVVYYDVAAGRVEILAIIAQPERDAWLDRVGEAR
jgi:mRNA-degrading endonuclease RelE of RelBE toxin-antitoxin system